MLIARKETSLGARAESRGYSWKSTRADLSRTRVRLPAAPPSCARQSEPEMIVGHVHETPALRWGFSFLGSRHNLNRRLAR